MSAHTTRPTFAGPVGVTARHRGMNQQAHVLVPATGPVRQRGFDWQTLCVGSAAVVHDIAGLSKCASCQARVTRAAEQAAPGAAS